MARHGQIFVYGGHRRLGNITDLEHYKLDVELRGSRLTIRRWQPETDWVTLDLFLDADELASIRTAINTRL